MWKNKPYLNWIILLVVIAIGILGSHWLFAGSMENLVVAIQNAIHANYMVGLLTIAGLSVDVLLPIPSSVISVWSVISLGFVGGVITIWFGMSLACALAYWLGAGSYSGILRHFVKMQDVSQVQQMSARFGISALILLRAVPVLAETSVLAAGLVRMPFKQFILATSLANAGISLVYASLGDYASTNHSYIAAILASIVLPVIAWLCYKGIHYLMRRQPRVLHHEEDQLLYANFAVNFSYPVCFTNDVFSLSNKTLVNQLNPYAEGKKSKVLFVVDGGLLDANPALQNKITAYCQKYAIDMGEQIIKLPAGEAAKTRENIDYLQQCMLGRQLDRQSYVVVAGGGAVLVATHDERVLDSVDRVVQIADGRLLAG